jgi:hypothetical protein
MNNYLNPKDNRERVRLMIRLFNKTNQLNKICKALLTNKISKSKIYKEKIYLYNSN